MKLTFRLKLLILVCSCVVVSLTLYLAVGTRLVINDKTAYVYDHSLSLAKEVGGGLRQSLERMVAVSEISLLLTSGEKSGQFLDAAFESDLSPLGVTAAAFYSYTDQKILRPFGEVGQEKSSLSTLFSELAGSNINLDSGRIHILSLTVKNEPRILMFKKSKIQANQTPVVIAVLYRVPDSVFEDLPEHFGLWLVDGKNRIFLNRGLDFSNRKNHLSDFLPVTQDLLNGSFKSGVQEFKTNADDWILGYDLLFPGQLLLVSVVSKSIAFSAAKLLILRSLAFGVSLLLIAIGVSLLLVKRMTAGLTQITEATKKVGDGHYDFRIDTEKLDNDEIGTLGKSFNVMSQKILETLDSLKKAHIELENYSKNLEKMVEQRTAELRYANKLLTAILNSLGQGFLIFDKDGKCLPVFSKACESVLESNPTGKNILEVLKIPTNKQESFKKWLQMSFDQVLPFSELAELGPSEYMHSQGRNIFLQFYPMESETQSIEGVVLVATDKTNEILSQREAERERAAGQMILKIVKYKDQFLVFMKDSQTLLHELEKEIGKSTKFLPLELSLRVFHTIKGGAAIFSVESIKEMAHQFESELVNLKGSDLENAKSELLKLKTNIESTETELKSFFAKQKDLTGVESLDNAQPKVEINESDLVQYLDKIASKSEDLKKEGYDRFLKRDISYYFSHYEEVCNKIASDLGKQIAPFKYINGDKKIFARPLAPLFGVFIHAFRNIMDHGIETFEERTEIGKDPLGHITLEFKSESLDGKDGMLIQISDDGRGIDPEKIKKKIPVSKINSKMTEDEIIQFVFESGVSTKEKVTDLSGRGVGMDAIKQEALSLGGKAWVSSKTGMGTTLHVFVPTQGGK